MQCAIERSIYSSSSCTYNICHYKQFSSYQKCNDLSAEHSIFPGRAYITSYFVQLGDRIANECWGMYREMQTHPHNRIQLCIGYTLLHRIAKTECGMTAARATIMNCGNGESGTGRGARGLESG